MVNQISPFSSLLDRPLYPNTFSLTGQSKIDYLSISIATIFGRWQTWSKPSGLKKTTKTKQGVSTSTNAAGWLACLSYTNKVTSIAELRARGRRGEGGVRSGRPSGSGGCQRCHTMAIALFSSTALTEFENAKPQLFYISRKSIQTRAEGAGLE